MSQLAWLLLYAGHFHVTCTCVGACCLGQPRITSLKKPTPTFCMTNCTPLRIIHVCVCVCVYVCVCYFLIVRWLTSTFFQVIKCARHLKVLSSTAWAFFEHLQLCLEGCFRQCKIPEAHCARVIKYQYCL